MDNHREHTEASDNKPPRFLPTDIISGGENTTFACDVGASLWDDDFLATMGFIALWDAQTYESINYRQIPHDNDFFQSRITHVLLEAQGIVALQQVDTHSQASLNQTIVNVLGFDYDLNLRFERTVLLPMTPEQRFCMWVPNAQDLLSDDPQDFQYFFRDEQGNLNIQGFYRDIHLEGDTDHAFLVRFNQNDEQV